MFQVIHPGTKKQTNLSETTTSHMPVTTLLQPTHNQAMHATMTSFFTLANHWQADRQTDTSSKNLSPHIKPAFPAHPSQSDLLADK